MRSKRKRVARKNSDSGVSVGSSVGLHTPEQSLEKDTCVKVTADQLNWKLGPVVRLEDVSLVKDVSAQYGVSVSNMNPDENEVKEEPFDIPNITITTSQKGRTVNGQLLIVPPVKPKLDMCIVVSSDNEDDEFSAPDVDQKYCFKWSRPVCYDLPEITSYSEVFRGATLGEFYEADEFSGSERSVSRCSTLSTAEEYKAVSPVLARRTVFVKQTQAPVSEEGSIVAPIRTVFVRQTHGLSPVKSAMECSGNEEGTVVTPDLARRTVFLEQEPVTSTPAPVRMECSGTKQEPQLECFRTPSQQRLKRIRLSNIASTSSTETPSPNTPQPNETATEAQFGRGRSSLTQTPQLGRDGPLGQTPQLGRDGPLVQTPQLGRDGSRRLEKEKKPIELLDSTVVRGPSKRTSPITFKIPQPRETKRFSLDIYSSAQNPVEDDALSIFTPSELETEIENGLRTPSKPPVRASKKRPLQNGHISSPPPPKRVHLPIQINTRWSPPLQRTPEHNTVLSPEVDFAQDAQANNPVPQPVIAQPPLEFDSTRPPPLMSLNFDRFNGGLHPFPPPTFQPNFNTSSENFSNNSPLMDQTENWVRNHNNYSPLMKLTHQLCRRMNSCNMNRCKFLHEFPPHYEQVLFMSEVIWVNVISKYVLTQCCSSIINFIIPMVINYYTVNRQPHLILDLMPNLFQNDKLNKQEYMKQIIKALIATNEGCSFSDTIDEILLYNGIKASGTLDELLEVIPQQEDFLMRFWDQIWKMVKFRKTPVPPQIVDEFVKECIRMDHYDEETKVECYSNACKFLMHVPFEPKQVNERQVLTFLKKLRNIKLEDCVSGIKEIYVKAGCPLNDQGPPCDDGLFEFACDVPTKEKATLRTFILDKNTTEVASFIRKYSHAPYKLFKHFLAVYHMKVMTISEFIELFLEIVEKLDYPRSEGNLKLTIETLAFNLLPLCDRVKDYQNACVVLKMFITNIKSLLSVKNYNTERTYRNLKTNPERIVFFIKVLTRANFLNDVYSLIKMPEFELFNKSAVRSLYEYKMVIMHEYISRAIASDLKLSWKILDFLSKNDMEVAKLCHFPDHYSSYLKQHLKCVNAESVAEEYYTSIKFNYEHINYDVLRAIVANLSTVLKPIDLEGIYDYGCSKSIYTQHTGSESAITLGLNLTIDEIKMVFKMFFWKMLKLNVPAVKLEIRLGEASNAKGTNVQLGIFKQPEKCGEFAMMLRLSSALFTLEPQITLDDHQGMLPADVVVRCLEYTRRNI